MSRHASTLGAYADVKRVFDTVLANGDLRYKLPSRQQAVSWRGRAYAFKRLLLKQSAQQLEGTNLLPSTPYDTIYLTMEDDVVIIHRERPIGVLTDAKGKPIDLAKTTPVNIAADPLQEEADRLAREADIEI